MADEGRLGTLRAMLADDPADSFTRYALALELKGLGRREEALAELGALLAGDPGYLATYYQYGLLLHQEGRTAEGLGVLRRGAELARAQGDAHTQGELEELAGDLSD